MSDKKTTEYTEDVKQLLRYICDTPELLSLLYDINMLPEQSEPGSIDWIKTLTIASAWKNRKSL
jgi:hypothetical protein